MEDKREQKSCFIYLYINTHFTYPHKRIYTCKTLQEVYGNLLKYPQLLQQQINNSGKKKRLKDKRLDTQEAAESNSLSNSLRVWVTTSPPPQNQVTSLGKQFILVLRNTEDSMEKKKRPNTCRQEAIRVTIIVSLQW